MTQRKARCEVLAFLFRQREQGRKPQAFTQSSSTHLTSAVSPNDALPNFFCDRIGNYLHSDAEEKVCVLKALCCAERRVVLFPEAFNEFEVGANGVGHLLQIVTFSVEAAALERTVLCKGREDKVSAGF